MNNLLNLKEAASILGIHEKRLKELVERKIIPAYMVADQLLRFKKEEVEALKECLKHDPRHERIFTRAFSEVRGIERFKEVLLANDIYLILIIIVVLVLFFYFFI